MRRVKILKKCVVEIWDKQTLCGSEICISLNGICLRQIKKKGVSLPMQKDLSLLANVVLSPM